MYETGAVMQSHDHDEYFYDPDEADDDADEESDHEYFSACLTQDSFVASGSEQGLLCQVAERLPFLNNVMQALHSRAGDEESLHRARKVNPFRASGRLARGAEHVPFLNNVMQGLHRVRGKSEELRRAKKKNPLGANGYVTKFGEHIPGLADTICCIHKFRGLDAEAERARAFSLHRMVGRQGAITQLAQLLPGTNLIAALLAEAKGDRKEAVKAMNLLKSWRDVASADGALARVAELLPGVDIISFGLMVNHGHFAHAVRAICKTRWVDVTAKSSTLTLSTGCVEDWVVQSVDSDVVVQPRATSLASGLVDVFIHLLDFDQHGNQRWVTRGLEHELPSACTRKKRRGLRRAFEDVKIMKANQAMHGMLDYLFLSSPCLVAYLVELANWAVYDWTASSPTSRCVLRTFSILFPPMVCRSLPDTAPSAGLGRAVQNSLPGVTTTHGQMPVNPSNFQIPAVHIEEKHTLCNLVPSVCAGASCVSISCVAAGMHSLLPLACLSGCLAGVGLLHRRIKSNLTRWLNQFNAESWKSMAAPVVPLTRQIEQSDELPPQSVLEWAIYENVPESVNEIFEPQGVTFEWSRTLLEDVGFAELFRNYVLHEWLSKQRKWNWMHPAFWILHFFEAPLRGFLNASFDGQHVPLVIPIELPAGNYSSGLWLPEIRVMLVLWLQFQNHHYVTGIEAVIIDGMLDQIANAVKAQSLPHDYDWREEDPRLTDFTEPINLKFDVALRWGREDCVFISPV
ncbi:unnamed protein product [Durusdinium trenchii]